jgi:hypothetical protein
MNTGSRIAKKLSIRGNTVAGVGCYSAVIEKRNTDKTVIKIGTTLTDPWLQYYESVIIPLKGNPFVPKVNSVREFYGYDEEYYVADMEMLYPTSNTRLSELCKEYVAGETSLSEFREMCKLWEVENIKDLEVALDTILKNTDCFTHEDACEAVDNSIDWEHQELRMLDMHDGNFMEREDGTLVIIDPWCNVDMNDIESLDSWWDEQRHG